MITYLIQMMEQEGSQICLEEAAAKLKNAMPCLAKLEAGGVEGSESLGKRLLEHLSLLEEWIERLGRVIFSRLNYAIHSLAPSLVIKEIALPVLASL